MSLLAMLEDARKVRDEAVEEIERRTAEEVADWEEHGADMVRGARDIAEGLPEGFKDAQVPKFRPGLPLLVHAGGDAGLFSAVLTGWVAGKMGSEPTTVEVGT